MPDKKSYLHDLPLIKHLAAMDSLPFSRPVTFLAAENGMGKSTLLEAIAVAAGFNAEGGSRDFSFSTYDSTSELYEYITLIKTVTPRDGFFLRAESYYNVASNIDELDREGGPGAPIILSYGGVSLHRQSHGESFLALVEHRFSGKGLYILDEPEAALSPTGIIRLMQKMDELASNDSQFIIATHSPMLLTFPDAEIYQIQEDGIISIPFKETSHYRTTVRFLQNPESAINDILGRETSED